MVAGVGVVGAVPSWVRGVRAGAPMGSVGGGVGAGLRVRVGVRAAGRAVRGSGGARRGARVAASCDVGSAVDAAGVWGGWVAAQWGDVGAPGLVLASKTLVSGARETVRVSSDGELGEEAIKTFYAVFTAFFVLGCLAFAGAKDPFYDGEEYREAGGDGTQNWFYKKADREEEEERRSMRVRAGEEPEDYTSGRKQMLERAAKDQAT